MYYMYKGKDVGINISMIKAKYACSDNLCNSATLTSVVLIPKTWYSRQFKFYFFSFYTVSE